MDIQVNPSTLCGTVRAIPSKSHGHRALICAALSQQKTLISLGDLSKDLQATIDCLQALGSKIERVQNEWWEVTPIIHQAGVPYLTCGESGSTLRFMLPIAAALYQQAEFEGQGRLKDRPLKELREAMQANGCSFVGEKLPLSVMGPMRAGTFVLPGNVSSQYVSGLLFAAPLLDGGSSIVLTSPLESIGYVDMTLQTMRQFGIQIDVSDDGRTYHVKGGQQYTSPGEVRVEGDWSNAAFFLAVKALGHDVTIQGLQQNSLQADRVFSDLLEQVGKDEPIDVTNCPDIVPILSVVAALTPGKTRIVGAQRLRLKESDRLEATASGLNSLGANVKTEPDGLTIEGVQWLEGGTVDGYQDHRMVMSFSIASLKCKHPVVIRGAEAVEKSYPSFFDDFKQLGGEYHVL